MEDAKKVGNKVRFWLYKEDDDSRILGAKAFASIKMGIGKGHPLYERAVSAGMGVISWVGVQYTIDCDRATYSAGSMRTMDAMDDESMYWFRQESKPARIKPDTLMSASALKLCFNRGG